MKKILTALAIAIAVPTGAALADDDCAVPAAEWQSMEAVARLATGKGWTLREIEIDDGCYEVKARTPDGRRFKARLNPKTLDVIEIDDSDRHRRSRHDPAPAGTVAPPPNGLFGTGTPPRVQVN